MNMKNLVPIVMCLLLSNSVMAQDTATIKPASIALKLGLLDFKQTNHTEGLTKSTVNYGIQYIKGWTKKVDFVANLDFASLKYPYYTSLKVPAASNAKDYASLDFGLNYKFLTDEKSVVPYVTAGVGVGLDRLTYYTAYAPVGAGLQIKANPGSFIFIQATHNAEVSNLTKKHYNYSISYSLSLKGKDKKPVMLPPAPLQIDADNDGVVDSLDKCPNQAGTAKYFGCPIPDSDNDGINDELDKCPNIAGTAKYGGCPIPDTDKDGVNDEVDKCPTVSGLTRYGGCPIPDTDKDGINDEEDKCPTEAGIAANHGCEDVQLLLNEVAKNFKFEIGKVAISKKNLVKLDGVVAALNKYPNTHLDIIGNTDNTGSMKVNKPLSLKRAVVVYAYLVKKGISTNRLTKEGFADTNPIDTNKTSKGRANNRRTDMKVNY
jgi:outer membrane protein OmpA-like peptidoglycan-associated protein